MLNAVWVAVIVAAFCWAVLVAAAVYVLVKLARLINQTSTAVSGLRQDSDAVIARAHATLDETAGQLSRTDDITASMDEVASNMAELTGRVTQFAPLAKLAGAQAGSRLARVSALVYGIRHAAEIRATAGEGRRAAGGSSPSQPSRGAPGGRPPGSARAIEGGRR